MVEAQPPDASRSGSGSGSMSGSHISSTASAGVEIGSAPGSEPRNATWWPPGLRPENDASGLGAQIRNSRSRPRPFQLAPGAGRRMLVAWMFHGWSSTRVSNRSNAIQGVASALAGSSIHRRERTRRTSTAGRCTPRRDAGTPAAREGSSARTASACWASRRRTPARRSGGAVLAPSREEPRTWRALARAPILIALAFSLPHGARRKRNA